MKKTITIKLFPETWSIETRVTVAEWSFRAGIDVEQLAVPPVVRQTLRDALFELAWQLDVTRRVSPSLIEETQRVGECAEITVEGQQSEAYSPVPLPFDNTAGLSPEERERRIPSYMRQGPRQPR